MRKNISLDHLIDDKTVLNNPHKGWYWHYYDNGFKRPIYRDKTSENETYANFPGLNHLYLRIDWADVQPEPDVFDWNEIDTVIDKWSKLGYHFTFRVCCNETWPIQCFAAPKWLYDMGCNGGFYQRGENGAEKVADCEGCWEPDYSDPMFLKYLDLFLKGFAEKFDGNPLIEYIDVGSYGCWGEGHTYYGSKKCFGLKTLKTHAALHAKHFKNTKIIVNDDFLKQLYGRPDEESRELIDYCYSLGFGIRDDSVLVGAWDYKEYHNVEHPDLYKKFSKHTPADIELAHYHHYTQEQAKGGLRAIEAARGCNVTFMGFHGYPDEWLNENYYVTEYLANRLGYWYLVNRVMHNDTAIADAPSMLELEWENAGFARCYTKYTLYVKYTNTDTGEKFVYEHNDFDNRLIMPQSKMTVRIFSKLVPEMKPGKYNISILLAEGKTPIKLGFKECCCESDGYYKISDIILEEGYKL